jgi:FlaG/FlaF family flagellin (archaellin)
MLQALDSNDLVYCLIEVGDKKKYTSSKSIASGLVYNESFSIQIDGTRPIQALYTIIKISVII